jgi:hypothetical protein
MLAKTLGRSSVAVRVPSYGSGGLWCWFTAERSRFLGKLLQRWRPLRSDRLLGVRVRDWIFTWRRPLRSIRLSRRRPLRLHLVVFVDGCKRIIDRRTGFALRALDLFLLSALGELNWREPFVRQRWNEVFIVKVRLETAERE